MKGEIEGLLFFNVKIIGNQISPREKAVMFDEFVDND